MSGTALRRALALSVAIAAACTSTPGSKGPSPAHQGLPIAFGISLEQAKRTLREAGWTITGTQEGRGAYWGPDGGFYDVEEGWLHATREGWHVNAEFRWDRLRRFGRVSAPLPSEGAVTAVLGEMKERLGEPIWSQPLGAGLPIATWEWPASIEVRLEGKEGAWNLVETWSPSESLPPPSKECPHRGPPAPGQPCQYPMDFAACTYTSTPGRTVACSCTPEGKWSCTKLWR